MLDIVSILHERVNFQLTYYCSLCLLENKEFYIHFESLAVCCTLECQKKGGG